MFLNQGCHLPKYAHIYVLARELVMYAYNLGIFPNVQLARKYVHIYARIYASDNSALGLIYLLNFWLI
jgi:hypothetical protein